MLAKELPIAVPLSNHRDGCLELEDLHCQRNLPAVNWDATRQYTDNLKRTQSKNSTFSITCKIPLDYNMGGLKYLDMKFISGNIEMNAFGGWHVHKKKIPPNYKAKQGRQVPPFEPV